MSMIDRREGHDGRRQATWWCGYCMGTGHWLDIEGDEQDRRRVYAVLDQRLDDHRCPQRDATRRLRRVGLRRKVL